MTESAPKPPKPRRRWLQFSLASALLLMVPLGLAFLTFSKYFESRCKVAVSPAFGSVRATGSTSPKGGRGSRAAAARGPRMPPACPGEPHARRYGKAAAS
jgi:hypothetical protein